MAPSLLSVKHVNITAAEKSGFFHHKILGFLGLHSLRDTTHIPGIPHLPHSGCPDYVDMLVWTTCSLLCVWQCGDETSITGKQPKRHQCSTVNLWNTDTCRQKASHHSWTAICPPSTPKSWFPSHKHKSHHKQEVSTLRMPKWRPRVILWNCIKELLPPGSQQLPAKSEGFPTALGIDSVFWISARRAGITCAKKTYFFVTEQVLTWLQSPPSWQKTNPRGKRRKSNLVPHSWAECSAVSTRNETRAGRTRGEQSWKQDQGSRTALLAPASRLSSLTKLHLQSPWPNTQVTSRKRCPSASRLFRWCAPRHRAKFGAPSSFPKRKIKGDKKSVWVSSRS